MARWAASDQFGKCGMAVSGTPAFEFQGSVVADLSRLRLSDSFAERLDTYPGIRGADSVLEHTRSVGLRPRSGPGRGATGAG
jgi:hypothetical protein